MQNFFQSLYLFLLIQMIPLQTKNRVFLTFLITNLKQYQESFLYKYQYFSHNFQFFFKTKKFKCFLLLFLLEFQSETLFIILLLNIFKQNPYFHIKQMLQSFYQLVLKKIFIQILKNNHLYLKQSHFKKNLLLQYSHLKITHLELFFDTLSKN